MTITLQDFVPAGAETGTGLALTDAHGRLTVAELLAAGVAL